LKHWALEAAKKYRFRLRARIYPCRKSFTCNAALAAGVRFCFRGAFSTPSSGPWYVFLSTRLP
jgi:hypothetical protein